MLLEVKLPARLVVWLQIDTSERWTWNEGPLGPLVGACILGPDLLAGELFVVMSIQGMAWITR